MKKLFMLLLSLAVVCGCGKGELSESGGNGNPNIPNDPSDDPEPEKDIFLQFCIENFDTDGDGFVSQYEADKVTEMNCADMKILQLTNIKKFSNLKTLDCSGNKLVSLDLSKNLCLVTVNCTRNSALNSLTVGGCNELQTLDCSYCSLTSLDISSMAALQSVDCSNNALTSLKVGGCTAMRTLDCSYNKLSALDLSKIAGIVTVNCKHNSLSSLVLTDCAELVSLDCSGNSLTRLDVSCSLKLSWLDCSDNGSLKELWLYSTSQNIAHLTKNNDTELKYYRFAIGDTYSENGVEGIIFYVTDDGLHGKIVSTDETICQWSAENIKTYASLSYDGMENMKRIQGISGWHEKYPAFAWCADKGEGWYLPTIDELWGICELNISNNYYWSSIEVDDGKALCFSMRDGGGFWAYKYNAIYVRAVSAF